MPKPNTSIDVDLILFDLDNTLYPPDVGLWQAIDERIQRYVSQVLGLPLDQARVVQKHYWRAYGTTAAGLMHEHGLDPAPYLRYVHDLDPRPYLHPNHELARVLAALPQHKAVFTNSTTAHAERVLEVLGIAPYFEAIIGTEEVGYIPKPDPEAYERCLALLKVRPQRCAFVEDSAVNLQPARALGMITILLGHPEQGVADYYIDRIEDLGHLFGIDDAQGSEV